MTGFDATESLTPFRTERGYGAILFDATQLREADPRWFQPELWKERAKPVSGSGRGGAWFIDASHGACVLRKYLRGGFIANLSEDKYIWHGADNTRSFKEYRLLRELIKHDLPVPRPIAAQYIREGWKYQAAILMERIVDAYSLADLASVPGDNAPWAETGELIARFHRVGLDHSDLNVHNILFDQCGMGKGWIIDLDKSKIHIPETAWRERNLARLKRSLLKLSDTHVIAKAERGFIQLREAYDRAWSRGI